MAVTRLSGTIAVGCALLREIGGLAGRCRERNTGEMFSPRRIEIERLTGVAGRFDFGGKRGEAELLAVGGEGIYGGASQFDQR